MTAIRVMEEPVNRRNVRTYAVGTRAALALLGKRIRMARKERRFSEAALAERVGIARSTLQRIEKGDPHVEIGLVFEAAMIAGVALFGDEGPSVRRHAEADAALALLPKAIREASHAEDVDDF